MSSPTHARCAMIDQAPFVPEERGFMNLRLCPVEAAGAEQDGPRRPSDGPDHLHDGNVVPNSRSVRGAPKPDNANSRTVVA